MTQGRYFARRDWLKLSLFNVDTVPDQADKNFAVALDIRLAGGLPPPDDRPSQEEEDLFVDIGKTETVITAVVHHMQDRAGKIGQRWVFWSQPRAQAEYKLAGQLLDEYVKKLASIARVGLEGPHTSLAKLALSELRADFTAQQAPRIKNIYVRSLGVMAALWAASLLLAYGIVHYVGTAAGWWYQHEAFLVAAAGASIGTWLSFSIRRVGLAFSDLANLEEDLLDPSVRIIFVIGLTLTACLLFWTGVMNIEIGNLKTNATELIHNGSVAMLIGVFFGISERALATAISGRAATFVRGIGGG